MYIKEMSDKMSGTAIKGSYVVSGIELKPFKNKPGSYLNCNLTDKTGTVKGVVWDNAEKVKESLENIKVFDVTGELNRYNDVPQVIIRSLEILKDFNNSDFVASLEDVEIEKLKNFLDKVSESIAHPLYKRVWKAVLTNPKFKSCPGGVGTVHHNYLGGLLQHVSTIMAVAIPSSKAHGLDKDLVLTGVLVHDLGKIKTYNWDISLGMSDQGRLVQHMGLGLLALNEIWSSLGLEEGSDLWKLQHIIMSHHDMEIKPLFPEASLIAKIDGMDAEIKHTQQFIGESSQDGSWTKFCSLTGKKYYSPEKA